MENLGKRKRNKAWGVLALFCTVLIGILICAAIYVAFFPYNIMPAAMERAIFPVVDDNMGEALPYGSMAIVEKMQEPHRGDVAAILSGERIIAARVAGETDTEYSLAYDKSGDKFKATRAEIIGTVTFYSGGAGYVVSWLNTYRYFVVALGAILLIVAAAFAATAGMRARKREKRELIMLFEQYGQKYDEEEMGIEY